MAIFSSLSALMVWEFRLPRATLWWLKMSATRMQVGQSQIKQNKFHTLDIKQESHLKESYSTLRTPPNYPFWSSHQKSLEQSWRQSFQQANFEFSLPPPQPRLHFTFVSPMDWNLKRINQKNCNFIWLKCQIVHCQTQASFSEMQISKRSFLKDMFLEKDAKLRCKKCFDSQFG